MNPKQTSPDLPLIFVILCFCLIFTSQVQAKEIRAAVGMSLAPYIIQEDNSGMEIDIVREALAFNDHTLTLRFPPLKQVPVLYAKKVVDAALTVNEAFGLNACLSDVVIRYQNYAITLKRSSLIINNLSDLAGKKIVAFQNAKKYLGSDFAAAIKKAHYSEVHKQTLQVNRLYLGRDDVVIADKNIFLYYKSKIQKFDTAAPLVFHSIFPSSPYRVAFRDPQICKDFNSGLKKLKESGRYDKIMARY